MKAYLQPLIMNSLYGTSNNSLQPSWVRMVLRTCLTFGCATLEQTNEGQKKCRNGLDLEGKVGFVKGVMI